MVKAFCDRCGSEIHDKVYRIHIENELVENVLNPSVYVGCAVSCNDITLNRLQHAIYCENCMNEISGCIDKNIVRS